jgi:hypothetical protein
LEAFLESARLSEFAVALRNLGATSVLDLSDLTVPDFTTIGMRDLQRRRLLDALAQLSSSGSGGGGGSHAASFPSATASPADTAAAAAEAAAAAGASAPATGIGMPVEDWDVSGAISLPLFSWPVPPPPSHLTTSPTHPTHTPPPPPTPAGVRECRRLPLLPQPRHWRDHVGAPAPRPRRGAAHH